MSQKIVGVPPKKRVPTRFFPRYRQCLETIVGTTNLMDGGIRQIDMDQGIFGFPCTEIIGHEDVEQIFRHKELGVSIMHAYIR